MDSQGGIDAGIKPRERHRKPGKQIVSVIVGQLSKAHRLIGQAAKVSSRRRKRYLRQASGIISRLKHDLDATDGVEKLIMQIGELQARIDELS